MPSLREVKFFGDSLSAEASSPTYRESEVNFASLTLTTLHLSVTGLSFTSIPSTLSNLKLGGVFSSICNAVPFFSQMPRLQNLRIELFTGSPNNSELLFEPCSASEVYISVGDLYERERDSYEALWKIFPAAIPLARRLTISFDRYPEGFNILTHFKLLHLEVLGIDCLDYTPQTKSNISTEEPLYVPPSVIRFVTSADIIFLRKQMLRSVEELEIQGSSTGYSIQETPPLSQWTTLRSLSLSNFRGSFRDISLPNLATLTLSERLSAYSKPITGFCQQLAVSSQNYPSFKHLKTQICPEWDILVIMLERRNLIQNQGAARVTRIELPPICPPQIRRLLIDLVQRRRVSRPSNFSLSFAGILDEFWDESM